MNDTNLRRDDSGLLFSPQPFPPGLVGQRHLDSTLFDVRQFDVAQRLSRYKPAAPTVQAGSGLIDIATLVGATRGSDARFAVVPAPPPLAFHPTPAVDPGAEDRAVARRLLATICVTLVVAIAMLALEALR